MIKKISWAAFFSGLKERIIEKYPYLIFLAVSIFPFWINVSQVPADAILNLRDFDTPVDLGFDFYVRSFLWNANWGLGIPNAGSFILLSKNVIFSFLDLFRIPLIYIEKIYLTGILFTLGCGAYYFVTNYFRIREDLVKASGVIAGLFYMLNIPVYTRLIGVPHILISVATYPMLVMFILKAAYAENAKGVFKYACYAAFASLFALSSDPSLIPAYLPVTAFIVFMHLLIDRKKLEPKRAAKRLAAVAALSLLINIWWLLPIFEGLVGSKTLLKNTVAHSHNIEVFQMANNLVNFFDNLRLHWTKRSFSVLAPDGTPYFSPDYIQRFYNSSFSYAVFLAFLVAGVFVSAKDALNRKGVVVITLTGLISMFFSLGIHAPFFGVIHEFLFYNMPGFQVLRNFFKFQYIILIWYASMTYLLSGYLFARYREDWLKKALVIAGFAVFIILNALPLTARNLAGRHEFFKIPDYYLKAKAWATTNYDGLYRQLVIPQGTWEETYEWGPKFELVPIHRNFFRNTSLLMQEPDDVKKIIEPIEDLKVKDLGNYLSLMNVRHVLIRSDIYKTNLTRKNEHLIENMPEALERHGIEHERSFGKLELYKVPDGKFLPRIYPAEDITLVTGSPGSMINLSSVIEPNPALVFSGQQADEGYSLIRTETDASAGGRILFANAYPEDYVVDLAKTLGKALPVSLSENSVSEFEVDRIAVYDIYYRNARPSERFSVQLDGAYLSGNQTAAGDELWVKAGETELDSGRHRLSFRGGSPENQDAGNAVRLEVLVINRDEAEKLRSEVGKKALDYVYFIDTDSIEAKLKDRALDAHAGAENPFKISPRNFQVDEDGEYDVKALVRPRRYFSKGDFDAYSNSNAINSMSSEAVTEWNFSALNTVYRKRVAEDGLVVEGFFQGPGNREEGIALTRDYKSAPLIERPYFAFLGEVDDADLQEVGIEIRFTDREGVVNAGKISFNPDEKLYVKNLLKDAEERWGRMAAKELFIKEVRVNLRKKNGADLSDPKKRRVYRFIVKNMAFLKSRPPLLNFKDTLSQFEAGNYYYFNPDGTPKKFDFIEEVPDYVKEIYTLNVRKYIDLFEIPVLNFTMLDPEFKNNDAFLRKTSPVLKAVLRVDFDGDEREDGKVEALFERNGNEASLNALEKVTKKFPNKKFYNLVSIGITHPDDTEIFSQNLINKTLIRFNETKADMAGAEGGLLRIDGHDYGLGSAKTSGIGEGVWAEFNGVHFDKGPHTLEVAGNDGLTVELVRIKRTAASSGAGLPELKFKKVNPTRYVVDVESAKGPFVLVFSEGFHEGWSAYIREEKSDKEEWSALANMLRDNSHSVLLKDHFLVNGYANGWTVPVKKGKFQLVIEYRQQRLFEAGLLVSFSTLFGCVGFLLFNSKGKK